MQPAAPNQQQLYSSSTGQPAPGAQQAPQTQAPAQQLQQQAAPQGAANIQPHLMQGQQTVIVQTAPHTSRTSCENYKVGQSVGLGATMITIGLLCIIFNIVTICLDGALAFIGHGIWCGLYFILTGALGVGAKNKSPCLIIAFMVLSILASILCIFLLGIAAGALGDDNDKNKYEFYWGMTFILHKDDPDRKANVAMHAMMVILALIEAIVSIWASAICCHAACCCRDQRGAVHAAPIVQYHNMAGGQQPQVVFIQTTTTTGGQQNIMYTPMMGQQVQVQHQPGAGGTAYPYNPPAAQGNGASVSNPPAYSTAYNPPPYAGGASANIGGASQPQAPPIDSKSGLPPAY